MPDQAVVQTVAVSSFAVSAEQMKARIADAYRNAALSEVNMRQAVEGLEALRSSLAQASDCFDAFDTIDDQIGLSAADERFLAVLSTMRQEYKRAVASDVSAEIAQSLSRDRDSGVEQFRVAVAGVLARWREKLAAEICRVPLPEPSPDAILARIEEWREHLFRDRGQNCIEFLEYLAESPGLDRSVRSSLLVSVSRYKLSADPHESFALLERAKTWYPEYAELLCAYGDYWLERRDKAQARAAFEQGLRINPKLATGLCGLGDLCKLDNNYSGAEEQYQQATRGQPGSVTGYWKLLELYGRPELFNDRIDRIPLLLRRAVAVEPEAELQLYIVAGKTFQANGQYEEAQDYFAHAVKIDERVIDGHVAAARAYGEEGEYPKAEKSLRAAAVIAPNLPDVYWEFGMLYEQQERWSEALEAYERAIAMPSLWRTVLIGRAAMAKWKLERRREAEDDLLQCLERDPHNSDPVETLHDFVVRYYKDLDEPDLARSLLSRIRKVSGEAYEADYQNRLGNISYYSSEFAEAAQCYLLASQAEPSDPVYHSNLALAYQGTKRFEDAGREFTTAFELNGEKESHERNIAGLRKAEGDAAYAEKNFSEALRLYRLAADLQPASGTSLADIAAALEGLQGADGLAERIDEALRLLHRAEELDGSVDQDRIDQLEDRQRLLTLGYGDFSAEIPVLPQVVVEVGNNLVSKVDSRQDKGHFLNDLIPAMRDRIEADTGVHIPGVRLRGSLQIPKDAFHIFLESVPYRLVKFGENPEPSMLIDSIEQAIRENAGLFMGIDEAMTLLERWSGDGLLNESVIERLEDEEFRLGVCRVLRTLAQERVALLEPVTMLNALAGFSLGPEDMAQALRAVRLALKHRLPGNHDGVVAEHVPIEVESRFLGGLQEAGTSYALDPELAYDLLDKLSESISYGEEKHTLIVRTPEARPLMQRLLHGRLPQLAVLSEEELSCNSAERI